MRQSSTSTTKNHTLRLDLLEPDFQHLKTLASRSDLCTKTYAEFLLKNLLRDTGESRDILKRLTSLSQFLPVLMVLITLLTPMQAFSSGHGFICDYNEGDFSKWIGREVLYTVTAYCKFCYSSGGGGYGYVHRHQTWSKVSSEVAKRLVPGYRWRNTDLETSSIYCDNVIVNIESFDSVVVEEGNKVYFAHAHYLDTVKNELIRDKWVWITWDGDTLSGTVQSTDQRIFAMNQKMVLCPPNQHNQFYPIDKNVIPGGTSGSLLIGAPQRGSMGYVFNTTRQAYASFAGENEYVPWNTNPADLWKCLDYMVYPELYKRCSGVDPNTQRRSIYLNRMQHALRCNDFSEFGDPLDIHDISGGWDSTLNCGEGGYAVAHTPNDTNKMIDIDRPFIYDRDGKCLNCGGEGYTVDKCYENWSFKLDDPKCYAMYTGTLGLSAVTALAALVGGPYGLAVFGPAVKTELGNYLCTYASAGCIEFGTYRDGDPEAGCGAPWWDSFLGGSSGWYMPGNVKPHSCADKYSWYKKKPFAYGRDLPETAPEYSEAAKPEEWKTDLQFTSLNARDSVDKPATDEQIDTMISRMDLTKAEQDSFRMLMKQSQNYHYMKNNEIDPSSPPENTYGEGDLDQDIGRKDLFNSDNDKQQAVTDENTRSSKITEILK